MKPVRSNVVYELGYRSDIDGLRGIAVLPVLFFHAGFIGFSGGFVGVDVFFVISGFLITSIIHREIQMEKFSLASFYQRRIRRIFPALSVVTVATFIAGYFIFLPEPMRLLSRSVVASSLFSSNVLFWWEDDYFAAAAHGKPLLHTWSLSVEEQFYLFFPLFIWGVYRLLQRRYLGPILFGSALSSFALSEWGARWHGTPAFYLAPTRAWELLVGSMLAINLIPHVENKYWRESASVVGLSLILLSVLFISPTMTFPGIHALPPCIGAALLIYSGSSDQSFVSKLIGHPFLVAIGAVSYSLYLWHWPILVFAKYELMRDLTSTEALAALSASGLAAVVSWRLIEIPFRRPMKLKKQQCSTRQPALRWLLFPLAQ